MLYALCAGVRHWRAYGVSLACGARCHKDVPLPAPALFLASQIDSDLLKRKHLMRYTAEELATLLQDMGFDKLDLRTFKLHGVAGGARAGAGATGLGGLGVAAVYAGTVTGGTGPT